MRRSVSSPEGLAGASHIKNVLPLDAKVFMRGFGCVIYGSAYERRASGDSLLKPPGNRYTAPGVLNSLKLGENQCFIFLLDHPRFAVAHFYGVMFDSSAVFKNDPEIIFTIFPAVINGNFDRLTGREHIHTQDIIFPIIHARR